MDILESLFKDIKDAYPDFDKNKYHGCLLDAQANQDISSCGGNDVTLCSWIYMAKCFMDMVALDECNLMPISHKSDDIKWRGFLGPLLENVPLDEYILESRNICDRVFNETRQCGRHNFMPFLAPRDGLIGSAIEAVSVLLRTMRLLDYARIADRHLAIHMFKDAASKAEPDVKDVVEVVHDLLDSKVSGLKSNERNELDRLLYNAARNQGIVPSKLYLKNIRRLGEHRFGGGSYGDVYKGQMGTQCVAIKVARFFGDPEEHERKFRELCKEAVIWKRLDHPHILPFHGFCSEGFPSTGLVSPFLPNGDILAYLRRNPLADKKVLMKQICSGLQYMHCNKPEVVHGDLKCANVLIDNGGSPRIADFGLARLVGLATQTVTSGSRGTLRWQGPELVHPSEYGGDGRANVKTDIYAFGMTCLEIFTEKIPFHGLSEGEVVLMAQKGTGLECALSVAYSSDYIGQILKFCCQTNPNFRLSMQGIAEIIFTG